jgi:glycerate kinase
VRLLIAPDSFKGSLTSVQVAAALRDGWLRARPGDEVALAPLADGGEGTLVAIEASGGWRRVETVARDPLWRPITATWLLADDGSRAFVEMAQASGLSRLQPDELDPVGATSAGTGDVLAAAMRSGVARIILGIGGSATTDGGRGLVEALEGVRLDDTDLEVACDVTNPLLGPDGAATVYGPQKGADRAQVALLDERNARWADELEAREGRRERDTPGAGAAGGVGFALLAMQDAFHSFSLRPGIDLVMDATGFDASLAEADLVVTGEGRVDAQTAFGKTALGVAERAAAAGKPCLVVGGGVTPDGIEALATLGAIVVPVTERPMSVEEAMTAGTAPLARCGERIARLISLAP